jgi:hypothetical protein
MCICSHRHYFQGVVYVSRLPAPSCGVAIKANSNLPRSTADPLRQTKVRGTRFVVVSFREHVHKERRSKPYEGMILAKKAYTYDYVSI